ncbi:hypothetical protein cypCar_00029351, partial [Cyprinus carpio]
SCNHFLSVFISSEAAEELQPSSHATSSVKTVSKASSGAPQQGNGVPPAAAKSHQSSSAAGFPKAGAPVPQTGPSIGRVSSKGPDRPAPQAHPSDGDDSLVQRAEHIPAGTRTPMCGHCNMVIRSDTCSTTLYIECHSTLFHHIH